MLKIYLRQAWTLMKQNKLFTGIYVLGTGVSVAMVMTMFIIFYVKFGPIYPEYNRNRTLVVSGIWRYPKDNKDNPEHWIAYGGVSYRLIKDMFPGIPHVEAVGGALSGSCRVALPDSELQPAGLRYVDNGFWKVFTFHFLNGRPITQEESASAMSVAVLSASLAQKLFATTEATGRHFLLDGKDFQVCGVVSDVSNATPQTAADLWIPIYHHQMVQRTNEEGMGLLGTATAYLLVDNAANKKMVKQEVRELVRQYSLQEKEFEYNLKGQPDDYWESTFRTFTKVPNREEIIKSLLYILLALLFIPALNLSGMISSRMGKRLCELGIRKAYGATNGRLLNQVLCENLLLTATGGLLGLLFSYLIVLTSSDWVLALFDATYSGASIALTSRMLFNPAVFGAAFGLCVLLNVVSALIPAISALRHPIIYSLNTNR